MRPNAPNQHRECNLSRPVDTNCGTSIFNDWRNNESSVDHNPPPSHYQPSNSKKPSRFKNPKDVIGHLNVNSLRNKFTAVEELRKVNIGIGLISEIKIDESFPYQ